jgi:hypothetical protein
MEIRDQLVDLLFRMDPKLTDAEALAVLSDKTERQENHAKYTFRDLRAMVGDETLRAFMAGVKTAVEADSLRDLEQDALKTGGLDFADAETQSFIDDLGLAEEQTAALKAVGVQMLSKLEVIGLAEVTEKEIAFARANSPRLSAEAKLHYVWNTCAPAVADGSMTWEQVKELVASL